MARKKACDPKLAALLGRRQKEIEEFERTYSRLARAFRRLDKSRKRLARLDRRLRTYPPREKAAAAS